MIPQKFGRYEVRRPLGQGGMAIVYLAYDPVIKRKVAVKVLPYHLTADPQFINRFQNEVETIARLEHPCIVPVYDYGEEENQPYIVMRHMTGGSLLDRLAKGLMALPELLPIVSRVARALDKAHGLNIIHRDLKPGNILFDDQDQAYLSDFGLAKVVEAAATYTGASIIGTPAYMSPEQGSGSKNLDGRCDIYALGIVIFQALTGQLPYQADTPIALVMKHTTADIPNLLQLKPDLPPACETVVRQALAKTPEQRYAKAEDMIADLTAAARGEKLEPRPELQGPVTEPIPEPLSLRPPIEAPVTPVSLLVEEKPPEIWWKQWPMLIGIASLLAIGGITAGLLAGGEVATATPEPTAIQVAVAIPTPLAVTAPNPTPTLPPTETPTPRPSMAGMVKSGPAQLRDGPGERYDSIDLLEDGHNVALLGRDARGNWLKIQSEEGVTGWVAVQDLEAYMPISKLPLAVETPTTSPTPTEAVTATRTVPIPTSVPTIVQLLTALSEPAILTIDDFEGYNNTTLGTFLMNKNAGNEGRLSLIAPPHVGQGQQAIGFEFDIRHNSPDHYIGFDREFSAQDWSGYDSFCLWVEDDGSNRSLVLQFGESKNKFWKNIVSFSAVEAGDYCISLHGDHQIDLQRIGYYGLYVEGPPQGQGIIYIDNIRVVGQLVTPTSPPFTPTPTTCANEPQGEFRRLWEKYREQLGCPHYTTPLGGFYAEQPFQNGHMFWSKLGQLYLITLGEESGNWRYFVEDESPWKEGMPPLSCEAQAPPGLVQPVRGFGGLWCAHEELRTQLGWGLDVERGFEKEDLIQQFEGGFIFRDSDGYDRNLAYVLFWNNRVFIKEAY